MAAWDTLCVCVFPVVLWLVSHAVTESYRRSWPLSSSCLSGASLLISLDINAIDSSCSSYGLQLQLFSCISMCVWSREKLYKSVKSPILKQILRVWTGFFLYCRIGELIGFFKNDLLENEWCFSAITDIAKTVHTFLIKKGFFNNNKCGNLWSVVFLYLDITLY